MTLMRCFYTLYALCMSDKVYICCFDAVALPFSFDACVYHKKDVPLQANSMVNDARRETRIRLGIVVDTYQEVSAQQVCRYDADIPVYYALCGRPEPYSYYPQGAGNTPVGAAARYVPRRHTVCAAGNQYAAKY